MKCSTPFKFICCPSPSLTLTEEQGVMAFSLKFASMYEKIVFTRSEIKNGVQVK